MKEVVVEVKDFRKTYADFVAVNQISFNVKIVVYNIPSSGNKYRCKDQDCEIIPWHL